MMVDLTKSILILTSLFALGVVSGGDVPTSRAIIDTNPTTSSTTGTSSSVADGLKLYLDGLINTWEEEAENSNAIAVKLSNAIAVNIAIGSYELILFLHQNQTTIFLIAILITVEVLGKRLWNWRKWGEKKCDHFLIKPFIAILAWLGYLIPLCFGILVIFFQLVIDILEIIKNKAGSLAETAFLNFYLAILQAIQDVEEHFGINQEPWVPPRHTERSPSSDIAGDHLICPISHQLPLDPVTAMDGKVYERSAIKEYIRIQQQGMGVVVLKSPVTRQIMGRKLVPNLQIKNLIEDLINTGVIVGDLAEDWKQRNQDRLSKKYMNDLIKKADRDCNPKTMYEVGKNYYYGSNGFPTDFKLAYQWYEKAHYLGYSKATYEMAEKLLLGIEDRDETRGLLYLGMAAESGHNRAMYKLGYAMANGRYNLRVNKTEAIMWLEKAASGKDWATRIHARNSLEEIVENSSDNEEA